jgi:hypothetical protein
MLQRDARSTPNPSYKISSRGPVCLVACRETRLALMITRALEEQHYPLMLVPSAMGLRQPLLLDPDVIILDEAMVHELEAIGIPDSLRSISWKPTVLLGASQFTNLDPGLFQSHVTLPLASSSSEIMQTVHTLAQAEPVDGRQVPSPTHGQGFNLTLPVPAVS